MTLDLSPSSSLTLMVYTCDEQSATAIEDLESEKAKVKQARGTS
jgi:hypothetical protein